MAASSNASSLSNNFMYHISPSPTDTYEMRNSCKLRRQQPVKRESSRRILVRPVVQRRREPSISSSCESLDEARSPLPRELVSSNSSRSIFFDRFIFLAKTTGFPVETEYQRNYE